MHVEITYPATEQDLPETLRLFLRALPSTQVDQIKANVRPNVDAPYRDWTLQFRLLGETISMAYGDHPDLDLRMEEYPHTANFAVILPSRGASPEIWAQVVRTAVSLKVRHEKEWASRKLDLLDSW